MGKDEKVIGEWTSKWICLSPRSFLDLNFSATTSVIAAMCSKGKSTEVGVRFLSPLTS